VRSDLKPLTQPIVAGGLFVLYVAAPGGLGVTGLDPASGRTVWQVAASRAHTTAGVAPSLDVVDGRVLLFQPDGDFERLVAVDARSGATRWTSEEGLFTGWPGRCADDPAMACAPGVVAPGDSAQALRFAADSGRTLPSAVIATPADGREVALNLFDPGTRTPETLLATNGSSVAWQRPLSTVFTGPGLSTDHGWNLDRVPAADLFVGSVDGPPVRASDAEVVIDLSKSMTAGFRIGDGAPVWADPGSKYVCTFLPCPGQPRPGASTSPPTLGLRTRATGTATGGPAAAPALAPGANVTLEGFDLATGRTAWSFDAGADAGLVFGESTPQVGLETVILPGPGGAPTSVDLSSGARQPAPPGTVGWCRTDTRYEAPPIRTGDGRMVSSFPGNLVSFPCDVRGMRVPQPAQVPVFVGPVIGATLVWSETDRVIAVRAPG
jgi:outer membrane protein assembly factor BamB